MFPDRSLLFDRRGKLGDRPACHALIVGVSSYPNLEQTATVPRPFGLRLGGLTSAARSATRIFQWLEKNRDLLSVPLATCRMLLSPSRGEQDEMPSTDNAATLVNFLHAATAWRQDLSTHRDNLAWFYFAGHGLELGSTEHAMLFQEFGDGIGPFLRGAVSVNNMFHGMAPSERRPHLARTQVYFVDTGRRYNTTLPEYERSNTTSVFDADPRGIDDRSAGVFHATVAGEKAESFRDWQTLFSAALIDCLNGAAATELPDLDDDSPQWGVTMHSLAEALPKVTEGWSQHNQVNQRMTVGGSLATALLCRTDGPPLVDLQVKTDSDKPGDTVMSIADMKGEIVWSGSLEQLPVKLTMPAGMYRMFGHAGPSGLGADWQTLKVVQPSTNHWKVRF